MTPSDSTPSLVVVPAQDRPGLLVHFDKGAAPTCRPLPSFGKHALVCRVGVFLEGRLVTHAPLDPQVWEDMVLAGWLDHPMRLLLHVDQEGPHCLVAQWYLVGGIRAPAGEGEAEAEASGWLPRMLTFPQVHSRIKGPLLGAVALESAAARLTLQLAYGLRSDITLGDAGARG